MEPKVGTGRVPAKAEDAAPAEGGGMLERTFPVTPGREADIPGELPRLDMPADPRPASTGARSDE